jgi:hypothetical protein
MPRREPPVEASSDGSSATENKETRMNNGVTNFG